MKLVIHAGVAFSDNGRLLQSLQANGRMFLYYGASIPKHRRYRQLVQPVLDSLWTEPPTPTLHEQFRQAVPAVPGVKRTMVTDEEILGGVTKIIRDDRFYPLAGKRLAYLDQILDDIQIEVFLGIVNPGVFIPKVLNSLTEKRRLSAIESTDFSSLSWLSFVEDIRAKAPNVNVTLWSNEDTPLIWGDILRAMGDLQDDVPLKDEYSLLTSLLSPTGQREVTSLTQQDPAPTKEALRNDLSFLLNDFADPDQIEEEIDLPGWTDELLNAFTELYEQDINKIREMPDVKFLSV